MMHKITPATHLTILSDYSLPGINSFLRNQQYYTRSVLLASSIK